MMTDKPLVFHWSQPGKLRAERLGLVLLGFGAVGIVLVFWLLLPAGLLAAIDWSHGWQKLSAKPLEFAQIVLALLGGVAMLGGQAAHKKRARLILEPDTLRYTSGLPLLGRWLDWTLDLAAVRSNKLQLHLASIAMGPQPTYNYRLPWGKGLFVRQVRPAAWYLPNQATTAPVKPASSFGLVRWQTPENQALLQQQFNQLPLVQALRQRGIALPPVTGKRQSAGLDLMAYPRMKGAVIGIFIAMLGAVVLFHLNNAKLYAMNPKLTG